jgi:FkbM family methyltransferase
VDNAYASGKTEQTMQLSLPTWKSLTDAVLRWCTSESGQDTGTAAEAELQLYRGYADADLALFDRFSGNKALSGTPGFITDFLGVRTRPSFVRGVEHLDGKVLGIPVPDDGWHSEAIEWIGLLKSAGSANGSFTAMELGAGWAPWSVAAAAAARLVGLTETRLCAVEADPGHFGFILDHFRDNGLMPEDHRLICAAVGAVAGKGRFPKLPDPSADFGSRPQTTAEPCQTDHIGRQLAEWIEVDIVSISELLRGQPMWDLVHMDVQGWEVELCAAAGPLLDERVKWLVIGTHDSKLHGDLLSLMFQRGWVLENEKPPRFAWTNGASTLLAMTTHDGTQVWRNPRLSV